MHQVTTEDIAQMRKCAGANKPYKATVQVPLGFLLTGNPTKTLSLLATSTEKMSLLSYRVVDWKDDDNSTLIIEVTGDVTDVVKTIEEEQFV